MTKQEMLERGKEMLERGKDYCINGCSLRLLGGDQFNACDNYQSTYPCPLYPLRLGVDVESAPTCKSARSENEAPDEVERDPNWHKVSAEPAEGKNANT